MYELKSKSDRGRSFWTTLPGILTGIAALITAIGTIWLVIDPPGTGLQAGASAEPGPTQPEAVIYDFIERAIDADWTSNGGQNVLELNGSELDGRGFVLIRQPATMEDNSTRDRVLNTHPEWKGFGEIVGEYGLDRPLHAGDRFEAQVGFLRGGVGKVTFSVSVGIEGESVTVGSIVDSGSDGVVKRFGFTMPDSAEGQSVIRLKVTAGPESGQDWAAWIEPRLYSRY